MLRWTHASWLKGEAYEQKVVEIGEPEALPTCAVSCTYRCSVGGVIS
jgi:hypothetical protein